MTVPVFDARGVTWSLKDFGGDINRVKLERLTEEPPSGSVGLVVYTVSTFPTTAKPRDDDELPGTTVSLNIHCFVLVHGDV